MSEDIKTQSNHDISIALIQKDIEYIKKSMSDLTTTLAVMDKNFVRHDEITQITKALEAMTTTLSTKANHQDILDLTKVMETKVNKSEFDPIQTTLTRINWILISTVVVGLLALLYKAGQ